MSVGTDFFDLARPGFWCLIKKPGKTHELRDTWTPAADKADDQKRERHSDHKSVQQTKKPEDNVWHNGLLSPTFKAILGSAALGNNVVSHTTLA